MRNNHPKDNSKSAGDWSRSEDDQGIIRVVVPNACKSDNGHVPWQAGAPSRLFCQLALDHAAKQPTLTCEQLAELVDAFKDEPLPESLRSALIDELTGQRGRKQGRKVRQHTALEQVELAMLPGAYDEAMQDAQKVRAGLKSDAQNHPRRSHKTEIPTQRELALNLVRTRLPSLSSFSDPRLTNLISEQRGVFKLKSV